MMRGFGLFTSSLLLFTSFAAYGEEPYGFRRRLEIVHQPDRRDAAAVKAADEFALADGARIALCGKAASFPAVASDFEDYLRVSMDVEASVTVRPEGGGRYALMASLDEGLAARQYRVDVSDDGVRIAAKDERALAQAFYHLEDLMNLRRAPFLKKGRAVRTPRFAERLVHSGYGHMMYEEPMLRAMAHAGMTAIIVYVSGIDKTERDRVCDQRAVIRRAAKYGLDAYLYSEIPAFFHPDDGDAPFEEAYGKVAAA